MTSPADKPTLREQLDAIRPDSDDLRDVELAEAARAIEESDEWREVFERQQAFDREVAAQMQQVDVPDDLKSRLLERLAAAREEGATVVKPVDPPADVRRRRSLQMVATAAGLLLAVTLGLLIWPAGDTRMTLDEARHDLLPTPDGMIDTSELPVFDGSFPVALPDRVWRRHVAAVAKGLDWTGDDRHDGAVYEFRVKGRVHGYLFILPASQILVPPERTRLSSSGIDYHPVINTAWVDEKAELVYICYVDQGDLRTLQRLLYPHAA